MQKLSPLQTKWIRTMHVISACLWGGGALSLVLLHCAFNPVSGEALYGRDICLMIIDRYVVTAGALGCLFTGIVFAWKTSWGFFRFKWIITKWVLNLGFIIFGFTCYMPWLERMSELSGNKQIMALQTPEYLRNQFFNEISAYGVFACLVILVWVSVFKPWGKIAGTSKK